MDSLTGAIVAAVAAWLSIVAAILLPVPEAWFQRLRWVGASSIGVVGLTLVGVPLPAVAPAVVLAVGVAVAFLWPQGGGSWSRHLSNSFPFVESLFRRERG